MEILESKTEAWNAKRSNWACTGTFTANNWTPPWLEVCHSLNRCCNRGDRRIAVGPQSPNFLCKGSPIEYKHTLMPLFAQFRFSPGQDHCFQTFFPRLSSSGEEKKMERIFGLEIHMCSLYFSHTAKRSMWQILHA